MRGSNAVIQNNTINYVALDSYNAAPGFDGSMEGGFAQNVTVRPRCARSGQDHAHIDSFTEPPSNGQFQRSTV